MEEYAFGKFTILTSCPGRNNHPDESTLVVTTPEEDRYDDGGDDGDNFLRLLVALMFLTVVTAFLLDVDKGIASTNGT